jgi:sortase A
MHDSNTTRERDLRRGGKRIPLSLAVLGIGATVLLIVVIIYVTLPIAPANVPGLAFLERLPRLATGRASRPTYLAAPAARPTEAMPWLAANTAIANLPSHASADEAPNGLEREIPGQPRRILIPSIGVDAPVVPVRPVAQDDGSGRLAYRWQVPNSDAAGWHYNSAPLGFAGNTVMNGHHNVFGEVFRDLINVSEGAEIFVFDSSGRHRYRVTEKQLLLEGGQPLRVRMKNAGWMQPTSDERITLITCWPYTDNTHRVIVVAKPAGTES